MATRAHVDAHKVRQAPQNAISCIFQVICHMSYVTGHASRSTTDQHAPCTYRTHTIPPALISIFSNNDDGVVVVYNHSSLDPHRCESKRTQPPINYNTGSFTLFCTVINPSVIHHSYVCLPSVKAFSKEAGGPSSGSSRN